MSRHRAFGKLSTKDFNGTIKNCVPRLGSLTHWDRVTHICVGNLTIIGGSDNYLNPCWNIVNWDLRNKFHWNLKRNSYIFIQENAFENVICEMAAISSRPQCVKGLIPSYAIQAAFRIAVIYCMISSVLINYGIGSMVSYLGTRTSAGTVMTNFWSHLYKGLAHQLTSAVIASKISFVTANTGAWYIHY